MKLAILLTFIGVFSASASAFSQTEKMSMTMENVSIGAVLAHIEKATDYHFIYSLELVKNKNRVSVHAEEKTVHDILNDILIPNEVGFKLLPNNLIVVVPKDKLDNPEVKEIRQDIPVEGTVTDKDGNPLTGVTIHVKKDPSAGTVTDAKGFYELDVPEGGDTLVFSYIGYQKRLVPVNGKTVLNVKLSYSLNQLEEAVVIGYGTQKRRDITGAVSSVSSEDIEKIHAGATVSDMLAGQISGVSFRKSEGRPGSHANIQIRNMGTPLFVVDGVIVSQGQFNNISSNDIKSISVLKGAAAAIYGSRAANGVVVVETKHGSLNTPTEIGIDAYYGWQNMTTYANDVLTSAYKWKRYAAEAQINSTGSTNITPEEIDKWKYPEKTKYPVQFQSYDWPSLIFQKNAPMSSVNAHASGGSEKTNYYISFTRLDQDAVFNQYKFNRTNAQVNVTTRIKDRLQVGAELSGRIESRVNPGVPGADDYWQPLFAAMRNTPMEHPYANNNPEYLNTLGSHSKTNAAYWNYEDAGKYTSDWRVFDVTFHAKYDLPVEGLSVRGHFFYEYSHNYIQNHEFTYTTYTYDPVNDKYNPTGGSSNPWQERGYKNFVTFSRKLQIDYNRTFDKHHIAALVGTQWRNQKGHDQHIHNVPPVNELDIVFPNTIDGQAYHDLIADSARIGYYGRISYNYAQKYYIQISGRYDASWKFPPNHRWGFFPAASAGWRISTEPFFKDIVGEESALTNLKFRVSYGKLGDDNIPIGNYAYYTGYTYGVGKYIFNGETINTSKNKGVPVTNITWFTATTFDIGADFGLWDGKISGSIDYFHRKRKGLLGNRYEAVIPALLGYDLPQLNQNSDSRVGGEVSLSYSGGKRNSFTYNVRANLGYARQKFLHSYNPTFGNSWDRYRNSSEERWEGIFWGYEVLGQFQSQEQINNYAVNVDGHGNSTLLPGDLIYKDINNDGVINEYDMRPIGGAGGGFNPMWYGGLQLSFGWKGFDLTANFSFAERYWVNRNYESRWPFQNNGNLLKPYLDRWHLKDYRDPNSGWIPGKYPALRYNDQGHSNYNKDSEFWLVNVKYFRARTIELGYTLPEEITSKVKLNKVRFYVNAYNLFSIDNMPSFMDPAVSSSNSLQYPQSKYVNVGLNLTF